MHWIDPMKRKRDTVILMDFCHTKLGFQERKNILGTSLGKSKTDPTVAHHDHDHASASLLQ